MGHVLGKREYLENQSRRNNVYVTGIQENGKESWDETEDILKSKIKELSKISDELTIERAHRVNPKPNGRRGSSGARGGRKEERSRPIIAKFLNWKEKERVLAAARSIKPDGVKFVQDFSQATLDRRYELVPKLQEARRQGKIAFFIADRLFDHQREAPLKPAKPLTLMSLMKMMNLLLTLTEYLYWTPLTIPYYVEFCGHDHGPAFNFSQSVCLIE